MSATSLQQDWQTYKENVLERNKHMYNNPLLSDVSFLVGHDEDSAKIFPSHKYVLCISSPVFYAMFCGELAEQSSTIRIPDADPEAFSEFLRFLYTDEVNLPRCVLGVLYLANKYIVPSLIRQCVEFLHNNLNADNVLGILAQAVRYEEKKLQQNCWVIIENETMDVLNCEEFLHILYDIVKLIITNNFLNITELDLFKALDRWAVKQCEDKGIDDKRNVLNDLFYHVHYPSISSEDFICYVLKTKILNLIEISEISELWMVSKSQENDKGISGTKFRQKPHKPVLKRCTRFLNSAVPTNFGWGGGIEKAVDGISVCVDKPIRLVGARFYGDDVLSEYVVSLQLLSTDGSCIAEVPTANYKTCFENGYCGYNVLFDRAVLLDAGNIYHICAHVQGPWSYFSENGQSEVTCEGVQFNFLNYDPTIQSGGTTVSQGIIPELIFYN